MSRCSLSWDKRENGKETEQLSPKNQQSQRELETKEKPKKQSGCLASICLYFKGGSKKKELLSVRRVSPQDRRQDWEIKC